MDTEMLIAALKSLDVPTETWKHSGKGSLKHFCFEVENNNSHVQELENGQLLRTIKKVKLDVCSGYGREPTRVLVDHAHYYPDSSVEKSLLKGRTISRRSWLNQLSRNAAKSLLRDIFHLEGELDITEKGIKRVQLDDDIFPGIISELIIHHFAVWLPKTLYRPEGITCELKTKKIEYIWMPLVERDTILKQQTA